MVAPTARKVPRDLLPLRQGTVWGVSLTLLVVVTALDISTPASLALGTILSASVAFAALGTSRRTVWQLTVLCVLANLLAGFWNGWRDGVQPLHLTNRAVSILTVLLVGYLTTRAREASDRAAQLAEEERQLSRERALRQLMADMGGPLGQAEFVARAASALRQLSGAEQVEIGALRWDTLDAPHALATAPDRARPPGHLNTPLPQAWLTRPQADENVWFARGGGVLLAHLRRPGKGDLLVSLSAPQVSTTLIGEAIHALQPLLERTALLDDLRENRRQLAQRTELLRDLVYAFSHDLRTPLLANAMNMQAALRGAYGPLPVEYRSVLHNGLDANETLLALADQLLLVAKYESGENAGEDFQHVNLRETLQSVMHSLASRAAERQVKLEADLDDLSVPGGRHDLRRAVQNLLENAVKFSPAGGTVSIHLTVQDGMAQLNVQDDGPGVPAEQQAHLFQRFRSGGAGRGTGLGLYLTRQIAQAHGGQVGYARAEGHSLFTLKLPLETVQSEHGTDSAALP